MRKGFTMIELVIVLAIISIMAAVLIPHLAETSNKAKDKIVQIYNGQNVLKIDIDTGEVIEDDTNYELIDIVSENDIIKMMMRSKNSK